MAVNIDNPEQNDDPEKHKQDLLKKQKEGKGHWKPELASNSEEAVCVPFDFGYPGNKASNTFEKNRKD
jgi:hypothetical protein